MFFLTIYFLRQIKRYFSFWVIKINSYIFNLFQCTKWWTNQRTSPKSWLPSQNPPQAQSLQRKLPLNGVNVFPLKTTNCSDKLSSSLMKMAVESLILFKSVKFFKSLDLTEEMLTSSTLSPPWERPIRSSVLTSLLTLCAHTLVRLELKMASGEFSTCMTRSRQAWLSSNSWNT